MCADDGLQPDEILRESFPAIPFMPEGVGNLVFRTVFKVGGQSFEGLGWTEEAANEKALLAWRASLKENGGRAS